MVESGVAPDDFLVMSQVSPIPAPPPHRRSALALASNTFLHLVKDRAVRVELTMIGFADRRLIRLGYAR